VRIGELAKAAGLTAKTVRFYEGEGLLVRPERTESGYRVYGGQDAARLGFIHQAKRLGLSLQEIRGILYLHGLGKPTCIHVRALLDEKLAEVGKALEELGRFREELERLREKAGTLVDCRPLGGQICGIVEEAGLSMPTTALASAKRVPVSRLAKAHNPERA